MQTNNHKRTGHKWSPAQHAKFAKTLKRKEIKVNKDTTVIDNITDEVAKMTAVDLQREFERLRAMQPLPTPATEWLEGWKAGYKEGLREERE